MPYTATAPHPHVTEHWPTLDRAAGVSSCRSAGRPDSRRHLPPRRWLTMRPCTPQGALDRPAVLGLASGGEGHRLLDYRSSGQRGISMRNFTKLTTTAFVAVVALTVTACGGASDESDSVAQSDTQTADVTPTPTQEPPKDTDGDGVPDEDDFRPKIRTSRLVTTSTPTVMAFRTSGTTSPATPTAARNCFTRPVTRSSTATRCWSTLRSSTRGWRRGSTPHRRWPSHRVSTSPIRLPSRTLRRTCSSRTTETARYGTSTFRKPLGRAGAACFPARRSHRYEGPGETQRATPGRPRIRSRRSSVEGDDNWPSPDPWQDEVSQRSDE